MDVFDATGSSSFSFDSEDIQSIISEGEENTSLGKIEKGKEKKSSSTIIHQRKSPRSHGRKISGQDDGDYNEEGEDMVSEEEGKEEKIIKMEDVVGKK